MKNAIYFCLVILLGSCLPTNKSDQTKSDVDSYFTTEMINLLEAQDKREGQKIANYLDSKEENLRERAVLAFASLQDEKHTPKLYALLQNDTSIRVKKACIYSLGQLRDSHQSRVLINLFAKSNKELHFVFLDAIGKCGGKASQGFFQELQYNKEVSLEDYSQGLLRYAYANKNYDLFKPHIWALLKSSSLQARKNGAAMLSRVFKDSKNLNKSEQMEIENLLLMEQDSNVLKMLLAFMNLEEQEKIVFTNQTYKEFNTFNQPYKKADYLTKIIIKNYNGLEFLLATALQEKHKAVKTAAAISLVKALSSSKLIINKKPKSAYISSLLNANDMALESVATYGIKDTTIISKEEAKIVFMEKLNSLVNTYENPRQKETYLDIVNTIAYLNDKPKPKIKTEYNHPIDWDYVKSIPVNQKVKITTTQGDIIIECKVKDAPGSVANFIKLVDSGYYNNKAFHRVVPNFVIQTGCNRGDGWGAPNWTQRSEFSNYLSYTTGTVGLASAGKDTESIQWFITHTYTPFLDGRYSIFAFVIEGMDVVDKMSIGDMVLKVEKI